MRRCHRERRALEESSLGKRRYCEERRALDEASLWKRRCREERRALDEAMPWRVVRLLEVASLMCLVGIVTKCPREVLSRYYNLTTVLVPKMRHDYCFDCKQFSRVSINCTMMMGVQLFII